MTLWPLLYTDIPNYIPGNIDRQAARTQIWERIQEKGIIEFFTRSNLMMKPFDANELSYSYLSNLYELSL
jgi:hypothetical protein